MRAISCIVIVGALGLSACTTATPKSVLAQRALAAELIRQREWNAAYDVVGPLCRERPNDAEALMLRGMIYTEQGLLAEARADLEEAVQLSPKLMKAHSALAIVYEVQGQHDDAIKHHERAVNLAPQDPAFLNNLGFSLFVNGRARQAIPVLSEAVRAAPTDPRIRNNLGFAYAASGDLTRAAEQFAIAGPPAQAKNNLGWAYERRGELNNAFDLYAEAVALEPESTVARENLGRVAAALGRDTAPADIETPKS